MLRFILWALVIYGIYRMFWPALKPVQTASFNRTVTRQDPPPRTGGSSTGNDTARRQAADREGEYIDYEELT